MLKDTTVIHQHHQHSPSRTTIKVIRLTKGVYTGSCGRSERPEYDCSAIVMVVIGGETYKTHCSELPAIPSNIHLRIFIFFGIDPCNNEGDKAYPSVKRKLQNEEYAAYSFGSWLSISSDVQSNCAPGNQPTCLGISEYTVR